jgi:hypothetical protein
MKCTKEQIGLINKYGHFFMSTGGNDLRELIERTGINTFNNAILALMQQSCQDQLLLLEQLKREGILE